MFPGFPLRTAVGLAAVGGFVVVLVAGRAEARDHDARDVIDIIDRGVAVSLERVEPSRDEIISKIRATKITAFAREVKPF